MSTTLDRVQEALAAHVLSPFSAADLETARMLGQRYALAICLDDRGATHAYDESGEPHVSGDVVIVYTDAQTDATAREEFADWGRVDALAQLLSIRVWGFESNEQATARADRLCDGCHFPASEVGTLTPCVVKSTSGDVPIDYCAGCKEAHESAQAAIKAVRAFRAGGAT